MSKLTFFKKYNNYYNRIVKNNNISFNVYPILYNSTEEKTSTIFLAIVDSMINILYFLIFDI